MRKLLCVAAFAMLVSESASADVVWEQAQPGFLANSGPRGTFTYSKKDPYIVKLPLVWPASARTEAASKVDFAGAVEIFPAGTVLPEVKLRDAPGAKERTVFCTPSRVKSRVHNGGLLANLESKILNSLNDSQRCFEDSDRDGAFDRAFIVGEGPDDVQAGRLDRPVQYSQIKNAELGASDYVTLSIVTMGRNSVNLLLNIRRDGKDISFIDVENGGYTGQHWTKFKYETDLGVLKDIFGIRLEMLSADLNKKEVMIRWPDDAPRDATPVIPIDVYLRPY